MAGSSYSTGSSTSTSTPTVFNTPQTDWSLNLSKMLAALGQGLDQWAAQSIASGQGITNDLIGKMMDTYGDASGLAKNLINQYSSTFVPMMNTYVQQAQSYNSEARQRYEMGKAESGAAQANASAIESVRQRLQSMGINVNSGMSHEIEMANRSRDAATRVGAGQMAYEATAAAGRAMTADIAGKGMSFPGMANNSMNAAYTGLNSAASALNAIINSGANAWNAGTNRFNAAANAIKVPPVAPNTQSRSNQQSGSSNGSGDSGGDKNKGGNQNQGNQGPNASRPGSGDVKPSAAGTSAGMKSVPNPNAAIKGGLDDGTGSQVIPDWLADPNRGIMPPTDLPNIDPNTDQFPGFMPDSTPATPSAATSGATPWMPNDNADPFGNANTNAGQGNQFGGRTDWSGPQAWQPGGTPVPGNTQQPSNFDNRFGDWGNQNAQPDNFGQDGNPVMPDQYDDNSQYFSEQNPPDDYNEGDYNSPYDMGSDQNNYDAPDYGGGDSGGDYGGDYGGDSGGGYDDWGSSDWGDAGYARGGVIPTTGGHVPRSASPSRGRQTDDIPARLNADEFVIPRDVVKDHGTRFFHKLIEQSRRKRTGMSGPPAKPKMRPALQGRPTFRSRPMEMNRG